jgi:hypothetical protein
MENLNNIQKLIEPIHDETDLTAMDEVVDAIRTLADPRQAVPLLFCWMEKNERFDIGSPGPFVHFIEEEMDYLPELEASLSSKPTYMTAWMTNRIANAETDPVKIKKWIILLEQALSHPDADDQCRDDARHFIQHQSGRLVI